MTCGDRCFLPLLVGLFTGLLDSVLPGSQQDAGSAQGGNPGKDQLPACQFLYTGRHSAPDEEEGAGGRGIDGRGVLLGAVCQPRLPPTAREDRCGGRVDRGR